MIHEHNTRAASARIGARYINLCHAAKIATAETAASVEEAVRLALPALTLGRLAVAESGDFAHDVGRILRHVDRRTGKLTAHVALRCVQ
jgi:hypothetical protein